MRLLTVLENVALDLPDGVVGRARVGLKFLSATLVRDPRPHLVFCFLFMGEKVPLKAVASTSHFRPISFFFFQLRYHVHTAKCTNLKCTIQ